jgi:hypothetical protein
MTREPNQLRQNTTHSSYYIGIKRIRNLFRGEKTHVAPDQEALPECNTRTISVEQQPALNLPRDTQSIPVPSRDIPASQHDPRAELEQLAWDVRAEKRLWKEAVERAKVGHFKNTETVRTDFLRTPSTRHRRVVLYLTLMEQVTSSPKKILGTPHSYVSNRRHHWRQRLLCYLQ